MRYLIFFITFLCVCSLNAQRNISNTDGIIYSTPISVLDVMDMGTTGTITNVMGIGFPSSQINKTLIHLGFQNYGIGFNNNGETVVYVNGNDKVRLGSAVSAEGYLGLTSSLSAGDDVRLYRDSAATLAQRNGANAQSSRIYGTYTDSSNYERLSLSHDGSGVGTIGVESGGSGSANQSLKLKVAGNGALIAEGDTAGNARGANAVDLQAGRNASTEVASGAQSTAVGFRNTASGIQSTAVGYVNFASGGGATAIGFNNSSYGPYASTLGYVNVASGQYSVSIGRQNTASGSYASAVGGQYANAYLYGQQSYASGRFAANGDAQVSRLVARNTTSGTTPADLFLDGVDDRLVLPASTSWKFVAEIVARTTDAGTSDEESAAYEISGLIERDNTAADTRIVGSPIVTTIAEDDAAWTVAASADTTNGALTITCTGNDETTVRWVATIRLVEVGG